MARQKHSRSRVKRYDPEVKRAVIEEARRTTIKATAESWGIPIGTVATWWTERHRWTEEEPSKPVSK